jgi:hypothetical protein
LAPVGAPTAHLWLLDLLYQRLEEFAVADPLVELERMASAWHFDYVDEVLAEWIAALAGMARPDRAGRRGKASGGKKRRRR